VDVYRKPDPVWPKNFKTAVVKMLRDKIVSKIKSIFGDDE
jgi:ribonuclease Z